MGGSGGDAEVSTASKRHAEEEEAAVVAVRQASRQSSRQVSRPMPQQMTRQVTVAKSINLWWVRQREQEKLDHERMPCWKCA